MLLAWVYENGVGSKKNQDEAARWSERAYKEAEPTFPWQSVGASTPSAINDRADWLIQRVKMSREPTAPASEETAGSGSREELIKLQTELTMDDFVYLAELARLYVQYAAVRPLVHKKMNGFGKFAVATVLLEGQSEAGKQPALAASLLEKAVDENDSASAIRLAQLHELGWGVSTDVARALALYNKGARVGQPLGYFSLARIYDEGKLVAQDLPKAGANYRAGLQLLLNTPLKTKVNADEDSDPIGDQWFSEHADSPTATQEEYRLLAAVQFQVAQRSAFFTGPAGEKLLQDLVKNRPMIAVHLGRLFLCAYCGYSINLKEAVRWYSCGVKHQSMYSAYSLARLLLLYPELETRRRTL